MFVKELAEQVASIAKEVSCDGGTSIGSHKLPSRVYVSCVDSDDDTEYELVAVEPDMLPGCGCWCGITFTIRRVSTSNK